MAFHKNQCREKPSPIMVNLYNWQIYTAFCDVDGECLKKNNISLSTMSNERKFLIYYSLEVKRQQKE